MFIDTTLINNRFGNENIGVNVEYKKKNVTGLQFIVDDNKIPLSFSVITNNNIKNFFYKNSSNIVYRSTLKHEIKAVQNTLNNIPKKLKPYNNIKLIGDKGYITKEKFNVFNKVINIITPIKKYSKKDNKKDNKNKNNNNNIKHIKDNKNIKKNKKNNKININLLNKRHIIENYFAILKNRDRIKNRKEKKIIYYTNFVYLDMFLYLSSKIIQHK